MNLLGQFQVQNWIPLSFAGIDFSFSNSSAFMIAGVLSSVGFLMYGLRRRKLVPGLTQGFAEMMLAMVADLNEETNGKSGRPYLPFLAAVFFFVFMGNALGMLPFAFTFTSQVIVNFFLGALVLGAITIIGIVRQGFGFLRVFCPSGVPWWITPLIIPVEIISYFSRPCSLAIRLTANVVVGHIMMKIFAYFSIKAGVIGAIPLFVNIALTGFELFVSFLQAYIFTALSCIYLSDALHSH
jgi:F-type H+-transporting ATPase subunit a